MTSTSYPGVMVSSTFTDLVEHRTALIKAIDGQDLKAVVMENDSARPAVDVIDSSLEMVAKSAAYTLVISHKYGQTPEDAEKNPDQLSLTELEFDEAVTLGLPVLLFIMGPEHDVKPGHVETDPEKRRKLDAFRERAKVKRVYAVFNDLAEFKVQATQAVAELRRYLDKDAAPERVRDFIPAAPAFYAEPPYIGSHKFVGRQAELERLSDWAAAADPNPVLLFEAIGGTGKSMLTWEWTTNHATKVRSDWAGRFWYSFYEKGAVMADFCRRALAYTTGLPLDTFRRKKTPELSELLLQQLRLRPWLFVLDGLERVLVAYHRIDSAQVRDEEAGTSDAIAQRDPRAAIRPEDDDLLRNLASAAPSKLLITSRLIPRVLLNPSGQSIVGVRHERLPGLRPADAEALLRSCGISGDSRTIQNYLQAHCDCHPLVTGVLAGLINDYLPARGNFDVWSPASDGGAALNLAELDLIQKRNHILRSAIDALRGTSRELLSTLALVSAAVDYPTLSALNAYAAKELKTTVLDLQRRGLLQYDGQQRRYDLHPVVRGTVGGGLQDEEKQRYGQRVVDHFSGQSHNPYDDAETLADLSNNLHVVRTLLQMDRHQDASNAYSEMASALIFNMEAYTEVVSLLRPFFPNGWQGLPLDVHPRTASNLANDAGIALRFIGEYSAALAAYASAIDLDIPNQWWTSLRVQIANVSVLLLAQNRIAAAERCGVMALDLAMFVDAENVFKSRLLLYEELGAQGRWSEAEEMWDLLNPMGRSWNRYNYRPGDSEYCFALLRFWKGELNEEDLAQAETLARAGKNRNVIRSLYQLRGTWHLEQEQWSAAVEALNEAVRMAHEVGQRDIESETRLAIANFRLGRVANVREHIELLASSQYVSDLDLAGLCLAIGDRDEAKKHALAAYKYAWADGEPYVRRYELTKSRALLEQLGTEIPDLPPYDPGKDPPFPWEKDVREAIERLKAEKEKEQTE